MGSSSCETAKGRHAGSRLDNLLGVALGLSLAILTLSVSATDSTYNRSAYANNDVTVNTINSGSMVVMIINASPSIFDAREFVVSAYPLYAAADKAITSMNNVIMVGWCGWKTTELNNSMSCTNGSLNNNEAGFRYVFAQMRFPSWNGTTVPSPDRVDLSTLQVLQQLAVSSFAGTYDPDRNTTSNFPGYITNISYNSAAVYAVFGVLLAVVVIALIITCVCICKSDNAMASVSKNIVDKAINALRSNHHKPYNDSISANNNFAEHYNINDAALVNGPPLTSGMPATTTAGASQREGSNTYSPTPNGHASDEREMREINERQNAAPHAPSLQKGEP